MSTGLLVPPVNFGMVEEGVYRMGQPGVVNLPFLQTLGLRTLVWLAVEEPKAPLRSFASAHHIQIHHLGFSEGGNPWDPLTEALVIEALQVVVDGGQNYPLAISCDMGRHRTGTVVGCLRRLQGWNLASVTEEYRRYAGARNWRVLNELHIETFNTDGVKLPASHPLWLPSPP